MSPGGTSDQSSEETPFQSLPPHPPASAMDDLQVYFCDLCNTSIPEEDLENGRAIRFKDQRIGACCTEGLVTQLGSKEGEPTAGAGKAGSGKGEGSSALAPVLLVLAFAAGVIWLESRFAEESERQGASIGNIAERVQMTAEDVTSLQTRLDAAAVQRNEDRLVRQEQGASWNTQVEQLGSTLVKVEQRQSAAMQQLGNTLRQVRSEIPDHRAELAALVAELSAVQARLAALEAAPTESTAAPADFGVPLLAGGGSGADGAASGLPAELRHQVQRLTDEDPGVRFDAAAALLESGDPQVVEHVLPLCKDSDAFVRRLVVEELAKFPGPEVVEALIVALADPEENVRYAAHGALKKITGARINYDPSASSSDRAKGQRRWRDWWERNKGRFG